MTRQCWCRPFILTGALHLWCHEWIHQHAHFDLTYSYCGWEIRMECSFILCWLCFAPRQRSQAFPAALVQMGGCFVKHGSRKAVLDGSNPTSKTPTYPRLSPHFLKQFAVRMQFVARFSQCAESAGISTAKASRPACPWPCSTNSCMRGLVEFGEWKRWVI